MKITILVLLVALGGLYSQCVSLNNKYHKAKAECVELSDEINSYKRILRDFTNSSSESLVILREMKTANLSAKQNPPLAEIGDTPIYSDESYILPFPDNLRAAEADYDAAEKRLSRSKK